MFNPTNSTLHVNIVQGLSLKTMFAYIEMTPITIS